MTTTSITNNLKMLVFQILVLSSFYTCFEAYVLKW